MEEDTEKRRRAAQATEAHVRSLLPQVRHLRACEFTAICAESPQPLLLDVRTAEEWSRGTVGRGRRVESAREAEEEARAAVAAGRTVVAFCTVGLRSGALVDWLGRAGVPAANYSVLAQVWAGEPLRLPDDGGDGRGVWNGSVHGFSATYAEMWPPGISVTVFSPVRAGWEGVRAAPATVAALVGGRFDRAAGKD